MFLKNSIERILNEPATQKRSNAELKKVCQSALGKSAFSGCMFRVQSG